jgi:hypothetical protein
MRRLVIVCFAVSLLSIAAFNQAYAVKLGAGSASCSAFLKHLDQDTKSARDLVHFHYGEWTGGFITALNVEKNISKGEGVDLLGVVMEVEKACKENPMSTYLVELYRIYTTKL